MFLLCTLAGGLYQMLTRILAAPNVAGNKKLINGVNRVDGVTALWAAACSGSADCVRALIEAGAAVETAVSICECTSPVAPLNAECVCA